MAQQLNKTGVVGGDWGVGLHMKPMAGGPGRYIPCWVSIQRIRTPAFRLAFFLPLFDSEETASKARDILNDQGGELNGVACPFVLRQ